MKKAVVSLFAAFFLLLSALPASAAGNFKDVDPVKLSWAVDAINEMSDLGIVKGYADGTFKPQNSVTKAEIAVMTYRLLPEKRMTPVSAANFTDLPSKHWAHKELLTMLNPLITSVYDVSSGKYALHPDKKLTRWEVMLILSSILDDPQQRPDDSEVLPFLHSLKDIKVTTDINFEANYNDQFKPSITLGADMTGAEYMAYDLEGIKAYALYSMNSKGIITVDADGLFRPNAVVTRAEVATMLDRIYKQKNS